MEAGNNDIMVDILMPTYNHAPYIAQAIEGVIAQQTDFSYRLIIGEDCSTDTTRTIVRSYAEKHPDKIKALLHEKNIGAYENTRSIFRECKGKYLAMCEGDDYWIDPLKLQKQISFLEAHSDYSICFHSVFEQSGEIKSLSVHNVAVDKTYNILDLANGNFIHTPSGVFRNILSDLPTWYHDAPAGDYVMHMINAQRGLIKYFPDIMAVYRIHNGGIWSTRPRQSILDNWRKVLNLLLRYEFSDEVKQQLRVQRRRINTENLKLSLASDKLVFQQQMADFIEEDPELGREWLLTQFPEYIWALKDSRPFKLAQKLSRWKQKLTRRA